MLPLLLAILAHADVSDRAFTPAELAHRELVLRTAFAAQKAAENDPPCQYFDELSQAMFPGAPDRQACRESLKAYGRMQAFDRHLRNNCREFTAWANANLRGPFDAKALAKEERRMRSEGQGNVQQADGSFEPSPEFGPDAVFEVPLAEQKNMSCAIPLILLMQYRKWALQKEQTVYSDAERALGGEISVDDFFRYLDRGERAPFH